MLHSVQLRDLAERGHRLARSSVDDDLRDGLLRLADEDIARAVAVDGSATRIRNAGPDDQEA